MTDVAVKLACAPWQTVNEEALILTEAVTVLVMEMVKELDVAGEPFTQLDRGRIPIRAACSHCGAVVWRNNGSSASNP